MNPTTRPGRPLVPSSLSVGLSAAPSVRPLAPDEAGANATVLEMQTAAAFSAPASAAFTPSADPVSQAASPADTLSLDEATNRLFHDPRLQPMELLFASRATLLAQGRHSEVTGMGRRSLHDTRSGNTYVPKVGPSSIDQRFEKKYLTALDPHGNERWTFTAASMTSDPVLDAQGRVCFRSRERVHVIDADGREAWSVPTADAGTWEPPFNTREPESLSGSAPLNVAPRIGPDGTIYVLTSDDALGYKNCRLMAVREGREQWSRPLMSPSSNVEVAGSDVVVRETVEAPQSPPSLLERIFVPRKDPSYVQRVTRLDANGTVRYTKTMGDPIKLSWSDDFPTARFGAGPDGGTYIALRRGQLTALATDGCATWTRDLGPTDAGNRAGAWIQADPLSDGDGNVYVTAYVHDPSHDDRNGMHAMKIALDGALRYDTVVGTGRHKGVPPVLTSKGELVVVTETRGGGIAQVEEEHLTVVSPDGHIAQDLVCTSTGAGGWNTDHGLIRSVSPGRDGEVIVELEPYYYNSPGGRTITVVPTDRPPKASSQIESGVPTQKPGTVEVREEQVVIGGVKIPRRQ